MFAAFNSRMKSKSEVVVIGGGIVGLSSAYYLAKAGFSVIVLEKSSDASACSYGNAGFIAPSHFIPLSAPGIISKGLRWMLNPESPFYIKPRFNLPLAKWGLQFMRHATVKHVNETKKLLADLCLLSLDLHQQFAEEEQVPIKNKGVVMQCLTENCLKQEQELAKMAADLGIDAQVLDLDQLNAADPRVAHAGVGGVLFPGDSYLEPKAFMEKMLKSLAELEVEIYTNQEVIKFETNNGKIAKILTKNNEFEGDQVVLATGSYTPALAKLVGNKLLLEAGKGYSVDWHNDSVMPELGYILIEARAAITPMNGFVRLAGTMELGGIDLSINPRRVAGYLKSIAAYLPDFEYEKFKSLPVWAGLRPCSPDGLPYVGRDNKVKNLTVAAGHAMIGFTLGPATGKLVAQIISGEQTELNIDQLAVNRY
jgi:D-amino-acid dehydrogenase